jgi:hypothetical protein
MWHRQMQVALVEKDVDTIKELIEAPLEFETLEEMQSAQYLLANAAELLHALQNETSSSMQKLKKNREFLQATQTKSKNKLDTRF